MIIRLIVALTLSIFTATTAIADDVYRWTDPESGKILVAPKPPPYPIKETRTAGRLPNGDMVDLVLDLNAPEVKVLLEKRKVREAEQKRIAEEQARQRAARAAEEERIAAEQAKEKAEKEAEYKRLNAEKLKKEAAQEAEYQRLVDEKNKIMPRKIANAKARYHDDKDIKFMIDIINEFVQYEEFASSTARIVLAIPINNLLTTKTKLDAYPMQKCYEPSKENLKKWMDLSIQSYYEFSAKRESSSIKYKELAKEQFISFWEELPDSCN